MSVEPTLVDDPAEWNDLVERAAGTTPFHRHEALQVLAEHSGMTPYPFVGYKGQEPVGLFPVFALERWPLRAAFSPPPDLEVSYLGPVLFDANGAKQRTAERRHRRFVEQILEAVDEEIDSHYSHFRAGTDYDDPRPFVWNGFDPTPRYTYTVDLARDPEELFMSFSSDLRRNVRTAEDEFDAEVREGDAADVERIVRGVRDRHAEQGVSYAVTPDFARDLHRRMPDAAVRAHVCEVGGEFVGGKLTLEDGETIYGWQTVADLDHDLPATDLLDWTVMQRALERGVERMDLIGANKQRLCGYKAKFNPEVHTYYSLESSTVATDAIKAAYKRVRGYPGLRK
jgi:CelD/BcsL family acetyltransferase involved in cellulose biosynthesis